MGELKAFYAGTSTPAELNLNGDEKYYKDLLDKAFKACFVDRRGTGTGSEKIADVTWELLDTGKKDADRTLLIVKAGGVVQKNLSDTVKTLLNQVADEEEKYYYSWYEKGESATDENGEEVLGNLLRTNALSIGLWITSGTPKNFFDPLGITKPSACIPITITGNTEQGQHISLCAEATPPFFMDLDNTAVMYTKGSNGKYAAAVASSSKHTCFYRVKNNELVGFWAEVVGLESGGGGGAMRADRIDEVDYRWTGNKALGIALGLEETREVEQKVLAIYFPPGTEYPALKSKVTNFIDQGYVVTNVPWHKSAAPKVGKGVTTQNTETGVVRTAALNFMGSEILYLKKFKVSSDLLKAKIKKRNRPATPFTPRLPTLLGSTSTDKGVRNLLNIWRKKQKGNRSQQDLKPEGLALRHQQSALRAAAGGVMSEALRGKKVKNRPSTTPFDQTFSTWLIQQQQQKKKATTSSASSLAATDFARFVIEKDEIASADWKNNLHDIPSTVKDAPSTPLLQTVQEWCHMYGHGDGGEEVLANFVSGSNHCNTEQLAIESGQRKGKPQGLSVRVTAYLFKNQGALLETEVAEATVKAIFDKHQLTNRWADCKKRYFDVVDQVKLKFKANYIELVSALDRLSGPGSEREALLSLCEPYPLANWIRYKIYSRDEKSKGPPKKIFDHIFDAQNESFNYHEYKILKTTVERVIAMAAGSQKAQEYQNEIDELIAANTSDPMDTNDNHIPVQKKEVLAYKFDENIARLISKFLAERSRPVRGTKRGSDDGGGSGSSSKSQKEEVP